jgi:uncharacterized membrane protein YgcG
MRQWSVDLMLVICEWSNIHRRPQVAIASSAAPGLRLMAAGTTDGVVTVFNCPLLHESTSSGGDMSGGGGGGGGGISTGPSMARGGGDDDEDGCVSH